MILPDIAERHRSLVHEVVFTAAVVLNRGEATIDLIPENRRPEYFRMAAESGGNTLSVPFEEAYARFFNDLPEEEARGYYRLLTPQPFRPYLDRALYSARSISVDRRFILCLKDRTFPPETAESFAAKLGVAPEPIDAAHDVMLSQPAELAALVTRLPEKK